MPASALKYPGLIGKMTLEEKASLLSGANFWNTKPIPRLGIPSIMLTDGPHGLRKQGGKSDHLGLNASLPATCFPTAITLAASWDTELVSRVGQAIGHEAAAENVRVLLGPGLNIIRNPLGGRTFEYFSEDPYLTGVLASHMTQGIQSTGVAATPKHYAVNSQEHLRMSIDEIVDERSLHEIYLEGFRRVVQEARPRAIMSSYNKVNGTLANEHPYLFDTVLKKQWGFDGLIVTDWGGEGDRVKGLVAGNQLEMPSTSGITDQEVVTAVQSGELSEALLDSRVDDILSLIFHDTPSQAATKVSYENHHRLAVEAAEKAIVLLQNKAGTLPLASRTRTAIIGDFAARARYQGAGSSLINPTHLDHARESLQNTSLDIIGYEPGFRRHGKPSRQLLSRAVALAKNADAVLLFLGLDEAAESESVDRSTMQLAPSQLALVEALGETSARIIVVLAGGGPVELPFAPQVDAILHSQLAGQGSGTAIARVIMGDTTPSGKLTVSYPHHYKDVPSAALFPGKEVTAEHREGIYVGYRYYDTAEKDVLFPFGHGLSYTSFSYSKLNVTTAKATVTITNTGDVAGEEVVQVYVRPLYPSTFRPLQELKGFVKVALKPGQSKTVSVAFDDHAFSYYDVSQHQWLRAPSDYTIAVGSSSRDIRLTDTVKITGTPLKDPYDKTKLTSYYSGAVQHVSPHEFDQLLGHSAPRSLWDRRAPLTSQDTVRQLHYTNWLGRFIYKTLLLCRAFLFLIQKPNAANNMMFLINMPFYKLERFVGPALSRKRLDSFLKLINKRR